MNQFTVDDVLAAFGKLDGERVNPRNNEDNCEYSVGGLGVEPSCLVGSIVFELDKGLFGQIAASGNSVDHLAQPGRSLGSRLTWDACSLLAEAQNAADSDLPWASAMSDAQAELTA